MRGFSDVGLKNALLSADGEVGDLSIACLSGSQKDCDPEVEITAGASAFANTTAFLALAHSKSGVRESMSCESAIWRSGMTERLVVLFSERKTYFIL